MRNRDIDHHRSTGEDNRQKQKQHIDKKKKRNEEKGNKECLVCLTGGQGSRPSIRTASERGDTAETKKEAEGTHFHYCPIVLRHSFLCAIHPTGDGRWAQNVTVPSAPVMFWTRVIGNALQFLFRAQQGRWRVSHNDRQEDKRHIELCVWRVGCSNLDTYLFLHASVGLGVQVTCWNCISKSWK